jgi:hypothetical protein
MTSPKQRFSEWRYQHRERRRVGLTAIGGSRYLELQQAAENAA